MAESFCTVKQGRGGEALFKWFSKAEFSLCDAPGVVGGRPCASLLLNMSSALHNMLHRAQISILYDIDTKQLFLTKLRGLEVSLSMIKFVDNFQIDV